jgi:GNAT superfamily N-acetyltransferase
VLVRLAVLDDAAALAALRWEWNAEHGVPSETLELFGVRFAQWMRAHRHSHQAFLAVEAGQVLGMAWLAATDRLPDPGTGGAVVGEVQSVYLIPSMRSAGRGSDLVRAVIAEAARRGMESLSVRPGRRSVQFYRRLGFEGADALLHRAAGP